MKVRRRFKYYRRLLLRTVLEWFVNRSGLERDLAERRSHVLPMRRLPPRAEIPAAYEDLATAHAAPEPAAKSMAFITARFRTGSTLLWQIVRDVPGVTAFYEPFHPRHAQDPSVSRVDESHHGVDDYWSEYDQVSRLCDYFDVDWVTKHLYLDARHWMPAMRAYLLKLAEHAQTQSVFQCNRVDFRLDWLRHQFPHAPIVHLYRHPRDQWVSCLRDSTTRADTDLVKTFWKSDHYDVTGWCRDLKSHFPLLGGSMHPYEKFYLLWRLSFMYGRQYADLSISYEELVGSPHTTIERLFNTLGIAQDPERHVQKVKSGSTGRWRTYQSDAWFVVKESRCEELVQSYIEHVGALPDV